MQSVERCKWLCIDTAVQPAVSMSGAYGFNFNTETDIFLDILYDPLGDVSAEPCTAHRRKNRVISERCRSEESKV